MGVLSISLDKWHKEYNKEGIDKIAAFVSINTRGLPKDINEITLQNESLGKLILLLIINNIGIKFQLPIRDNLKQGIRDSKTYFHKFTGFFSILSIVKLIKIIGYLPEYLQRKIIEKNFTEFEFIYSNIPFSSEPFYICNKQITKLRVFSNTYYRWKCFFAATTYRNELSLT